MVTNFKKVLLSCIGLFALAACKPTFEGTLDVREELTLKTKKETLIVSPGLNAAKLTLRSKTEAKLEISVEGTHNNVSALFKIPTKDIPDNGTFKILAKDVKQAYDIEGEIATAVEISDYIYSQRTCQRRVFIGYHCAPKPNGGEVCYAVYDYINGWERIRYRNEMTTQNLELGLFKENTETLAAIFKGVSVLNRVVDLRVISGCY